MPNVEEIDVLPGQVWEDKDKRMQGRKVVVTRSDPHGFTHYYHRARASLAYRSRTPRFRRAFRLLGEHEV